MMKNLLLTAALAAGSLAASADYTLPFDFKMDSQDQLEECTKQGEWYFDFTKQFTNENVFLSGGSGTEWIIFPAVDFGDAKKVEISINALPVMSESESFEVCLGTEESVAGMTQKVMTESMIAKEFTDKEMKTYTATADVEGGVHYVGVHVTTNKVNYAAGIGINNLKVTKVDTDEPNPGVGVESIEADTQAAEYYSLQGVRIANPEKGQLVIVRKGNKAFKAIL